MATSNWLEYIPMLLKGAWLTLVLTATSMIVGTLIAFPLALMKISGSRFARGVAAFYGTLIRGLPLLVQILFVYFGLPMLTGIRMPAVVAGGIAMALYTGGFLAEVVRAGIQSIDKGQMEAGRSIGFSRGQTMRLVVLPQAFWTMIPNIANQFSVTLKNTSLLSVVGVTELTMAGQNIYALNFDTIRVLSLVGAIYLIVYLIAEQISAYVERRIPR
ncbi:amino acid ABC transporter permease [Cupriavidus basilensis]|uniref:Amino acid ABC transporter permease n=1 Tax=Cupriavidus basilensis TaxID=68895 RepID=A0ABT6B0W7_9BURK|nr:amino acid ABC transporter permease [Cupriavidus basilensis]MDF3838258.1 amino acid ABC transporter permease [Cupriavidus basilensis]